MCKPEDKNKELPSHGPEGAHSLHATKSTTTCQRVNSLLETLALLVASHRSIHCSAARRRHNTH
jgi:hypothetical protein